MGECWIHTERLSLRPYQNEDLDQVLSFLGDSETMSFYPSPFSREKVIEMIERNIETWRKSSFGLMIVVEKGCEEIVGDCGITIQNIDERDEHEVGYRFDRRVWGRGYASEAAIAIIRYGFKTLGLAKLSSYMPSDHLQSRRVAEKVGMGFEKEYRNSKNRDKLTSVYSMIRG